ncbi:ATP synthase F1 subunit delta [Phocaeicola sp.]|uniref:ATP synthase F1 subunit delta n=1 Tax=Phocaeicola sp. TaxID=2773926 RepID=UPI00386F77F5
MAKLVSKTYGDALFAVALEENRMDEFFEAVKVVAEILRTNDEFGKLMNHPKIMKEDKVKIVEDTFSGRIPKEIVGVMTILVTKGRAEEMLSVFDYFIDLVKEEKKIGIASVTTAVRLSDKQKAKVEQKLLDTTKYETFEMNYSVDASLIGGMVIRIGDRVVDSSIKTKLYELSRELRNVQV